MIDERLSKKIMAISSLAIFAVVAWHCDCGSSIELWFIPWFTTWSVPWFFAVSGFFLVKTFEKYSVVTIIKKKIRTLVLPYLFWCSIGWCVWRPSFCGVWEIWGVSRSIFPCGNWPLWYVRALIIFIVVELSIYSFRAYISSNKILIILSSVSVFLVVYILKICSIGVCPISSIVFFILGGFCAAWGCVTTDGLSLRSRWVILFGASSGYIVIKSLCVSHIAMNSAILMLLIAIWFAFDIFDIKFINSKWLTLTAGIYFMHGPIIKTFDKYFATYISSNLNLCLMNVYYCTKTICFFTMSALLCYAIKRFFPRISYLLFGGR